MSLTSYRAAPPRDKPLRALPKTGAETNLAQRPRAPIRLIRRLPEKATLGLMPLGANGMYQRELALERAVGDLLSFL